MLETVTSVDVVNTAADGPLDVEAAYGLLLDVGDGWRWVCHEAITTEEATVRPHYARGSDGRWLGIVPDTTQGRPFGPSDAIGQTLFLSLDGCAWDHVDGLDDQLVIAAEFDATESDTAWAITGNRDGDNAVYVSNDGGATWHASFVPSEPRMFSQIVQTRNALWVSAIDVAGDVPYLYRWDRLDAHWVEQTFDPPKPGLTGLVGFDIDAIHEDEQLMWARLDVPGSDTLLRSTDGGETWSVIDEDAGVVTDAELLSDGNLVVFSMTGTPVFRATESGTTPLDLPGAQGMAVIDGQWWIATDSASVRSLLEQSGDEGGSSTVVGYPDDIVGPLSCPYGTQGADVCRDLWDLLFENIRGFDDPDPVDTSPMANDDRPAIAPPTDVRSDCGCKATGTPFAAFFAVFAVALSARRRSSNDKNDHDRAPQTDTARNEIRRG